MKASSGCCLVALTARMSCSLLVQLTVGTQYKTLAPVGCPKLASLLQRQEASDSDDDGGMMDEGVVRDSHFGGGFVRKEGAGGTADAPDGEDGGQERRRLVWAC